MEGSGGRLFADSYPVLGRPFRSNDAPWQGQFSARQLGLYWSRQAMWVHTRDIARTESPSRTTTAGTAPASNARTALSGISLNAATGNHLPPAVSTSGLSGGAAGATFAR